MKNTHFRKAGCLIFLLIGLSVNGFAQRGSWTVKTGAYSSRQRQQNILTIPAVLDSTDALIKDNYAGGYGRATLNVMALYDLLLTSRVAMQVGVGYRQKGFKSEATYLQDKGYAVLLPPRTVQDNLFHYASSELSFQFRTAPRRTVGYFRLGQRLDYLMDFKSAFWGDDYGYFTQFDYNVFSSIGVEYALGKKLFQTTAGEGSSSSVFSRPTVLFIEIEGTPLLFNISKTRFPTIPLAQLVDQQGKPLPVPIMRVEKIVRNTGFGVVVGLRF
ncbi:hypothetical protein [Persicitalea jodogahamensis]|uniref:Outer membrane protein beta-barrel domain-containing protein n=1 Tax=Persicitalea jodogahamensis TaxID=402147 RepID=A0A8J3D9M1_9BACT|nr:hypothetical protein [Persicitalea jodogahamensis]GHB70858.1 hypothetical protein GCM10007390_25730 [Persicitalea jodogahamensis]